MSITIYQAPLYGKISVVAAWSRHEQNMRWNRAIKIQGAIERQKAHVVTVEIARVGGHYAFRGHSRSLILEPIETCVRLIVQLGLYSIILSKLLVMNFKKKLPHLRTYHQLEKTAKEYGRVIVEYSISSGP